jgi:hypothetical protein
MPSGVQQTREEYHPDAVQVLFIGESPPEGGTFFYYANSGLYRATQDAFVASGFSMDDDGFLRSFQRAGCYLEDLAIESVNGVPGPRRRAACRAGITPLADRIRPLSPRVVVIIGYGIADDVSRALALAGHADVERHKLPFPMTRPRRSDGIPYRRVYVDELSALATSWQKSGILAR